MNADIKLIVHMFFYTYRTEYLEQEFSVGFNVICFARSRIILLSHPALVKLEKSLRQALIINNKCKHF